MSISESTSKALEDFELAFAAARPTSLSIEDEHIRFKSWISNVSADRPLSSRRSLEYRLRDSSELRKPVIYLLDDLQQALASTTAAASDNLRSHAMPGNAGDYKTEMIAAFAGREEIEALGSDSGDDELFGLEHDGSVSHGHPLELAIHDVHEVISCLMRFTIALRNPAHHDRIRQASSILSRDLEPRYMEHVQRLFPKGPEYLAERLGKAMSRHRPYVAYRETRRKKSEQAFELVPNNDEVGSLSSTAATSLPSGWQGLVASRTSTEDSDSESILSATSYAASATGDALLFPPDWPEEAQGGDPFDCPLCYSLVEAPTKQSWMQHLYEDFPPYVCTYRDCSMGAKTFARRREWRQHELDKHNLQWPCPYGCKKMFGDRADVLSHMANQHENHLDPIAMQKLADTLVRRRVDDGSRSCILCAESRDSKVLYKHLGHHLEQLTLFALPDGLLPAEDDSDKGSHIREKSQSLEIDAMDLHLEQTSSQDNIEPLEFVEEVERARTPLAESLECRAEPTDSFEHGDRNEARAQFGDSYDQTKTFQSDIIADDVWFPESSAELGVLESTKDTSPSHNRNNWESHAPLNFVSDPNFLDNTESRHNPYLGQRSPDGSKAGSQSTNVRGAESLLPSKKELLTTRDGAKQQPPPVRRLIEDVLKPWVRTNLLVDSDPLANVGYLQSVADVSGTPFDTVREVAMLLSKKHSTSTDHSDDASALSSTSPRTSYPPAESREQRKRRLIDEWLSRQHCRQQCHKPRIALKDGLRDCIWPNCESCFDREDDWRRHCLYRQPTEVFVCDICLDENRPDHRVLVTYRGDKIGEHRRLKHKATREGNSSGYPASIPRGFQIECKLCKLHFGSVQECLNHYVDQHYVRRPRSTDDFSRAAGKAGHRAASPTISK